MHLCVIPVFRRFHKIQNFKLRFFSFTLNFLLWKFITLFDLPFCFVHLEINLLEAYFSQHHQSAVCDHYFTRCSLFLQDDNNDVKRLVPNYATSEIADTIKNHDTFSLRFHFLQLTDAYLIRLGTNHLGKFWRYKVYDGCSGWRNKLGLSTRFFIRIYFMRMLKIKLDKNLKYPENMPILNFDFQSQEYT